MVISRIMRITFPIIITRLTGRLKDDNNRAPRVNIRNRTKKETSFREVLETTGAGENIKKS